MCGRVTQTLPNYPGLVQVDLDEAPAPDWRPRYNIAPTQPLLSVLLADGQRRARWLRWGLIPSWAKDPAAISHTINARAETVAEKPMYRSAFRARRCLLLVDGFYEWHAAQGAKAKQPYAIRARDGGGFALAGLWERWHRDGAEPITSCTIVTTTANATMAPIHDRMPVILDPRDFDAWLDPETPAADLRALLRPAPDDRLRAYPVSVWVNSPAHDDPRCLEPLEPSAAG
jgi:putative SOS response-associated peptidase YedK